MFLIPKRSRTSLTPWEVFCELENSCFGPHQNASITPIDVRSDERHIYVRAEVPGVPKKDISIEFHDGILKISGEKHQVDSKTEKESYYSEIKSGKFERTVTIGTDVDFGKAEAELENGVLTLTLPKKIESKVQRLTL